MTENATDRPTEPQGEPALPDRDAVPAGAVEHATVDQSGTDDAGPDLPTTAASTSTAATDVAPTTGVQRPDVGRSERLEALETEGEVAADYLEALLDIADLDGDIDMDVEGDRAVVSIVGDGLDSLVGEDGKVLEALQELTRLAVLRETGERSRLMLDIGGFRARRREELAELARATAEGVRSSGQPARLEPMSPFERKVVHDAVAAAGLRSESEGEEPRRRVVVLPA